MVENLVCVQTPHCWLMGIIQTIVCVRGGGLEPFMTWCSGLLSLAVSHVQHSSVVQVISEQPTSVFLQ